jgi:hypothetical protein
MHFIAKHIWLTPSEKNDNLFLPLLFHRAGGGEQSVTKELQHSLCTLQHNVNHNAIKALIIHFFQKHRY